MVALLHRGKNHEILRINYIYKCNTQANFK